MTCPRCGAPYAYTTRTHYAESDGEKLKRTRRCAECGHTFETVEVLASALRVQAFKAAMHDVVNGNGREEPCLT